MDRRKAIQRLMVVPGALLFQERAQAGGQLEEPLADSVRTALSSAIANDAPPVPVFASTEARLAYLRWLSGMSDRLYGRKKDFNTRIEFLQTVWYEAQRAGLDVSLVMGLIQVESAFRRYAVSSVGARGYMQVMPFWSRVIGDGDPGKLFHMQTNLRFGCVILRHYLERERGDQFMALFTVRNTTAQPMQVQLQPQATGLELAAQNVDIPAGEAKTLEWPVQLPIALAQADEGTVRWTVQATDRTS